METMITPFEEELVRKYASLWEVELMETSAIPTFPLQGLQVRFPLGSRINGNVTITTATLRSGKVRFPLGSRINGNP